MQSARQAAHDAAPWIERAARVGFAAKGLVYIILGFLAVRAAMGTGNTPEGSGAAFGVILQQPFGRFLLGFCAVGLLGYMLWRIIEGVEGASARGSEGKGLAGRIAAVFKGLVYGVLGVEAARFAMRGGGGGRSGDSTSQHWTAKLMELPFGKFLAVAVGCGIIAYGLYQIYNAWKSKLSDDLELGRLEAGARRAAVGVSRAGIAARGVVFVIIGFFLTHAAMQSDPGQARGLGGALSSVQDEKFGTILLIIIGLGLAAYGVYALINAKYRRIHV